jgi:hypothetical protein
MRRNRIKGCVLAGSLVLSSALQVHAQTFTKPNTTVSVYVIPGPSWLNVAPDWPTHAWLSWAPVTNAAGYRISRSLKGGALSPQQVFPSTAVYSGATGTYSYPHELPSDDSLAVYTFQVSAFFLSGTDTTWSGASPVYDARSVPNWRPSNLQYSVMPSTNRPGTLRVNVSWDKPYRGVRAYKVAILSFNTVDREFSAIPASQSSVVVDVFRTTTESIGQLAYAIKPLRMTVICVNTLWISTTGLASPSACTPIIN